MRKASPDVRYWFDFSSNKLQTYIDKHGDNFNLIIPGSESLETDFYVIPYRCLKHILVEEYLSGERNRWVGRILHNKFRISNCPIAVDISEFYGNPRQLGRTSMSAGEDEEDNDYAIENRKAEIHARLKQSRFRRQVLDNFKNQCCLSGIREPELLIASHIVPWASRVDCRLDPANGLCLFVLYDSLFDRGYITFDNHLRIIIPQTLDTISTELKVILRYLEGKAARQPVTYKIKTDYLEYHRTHVFKGQL